MEQPIIDKINELTSAGKPFAIVTIVRTSGSTPRKAGAKMIVTEDGDTFETIGGGCAESGIVSEALDAIVKGEPRMVSMDLEPEEDGGVGMMCGGRVEMYIDVVKPQQKLLIIGGGHVGEHVARMGSMIGLSVTVIDHVAKKEDLPEKAELIKAPLKEGLKKFMITPSTFIVIATRHKYDEEALREVVDSQAKYIGMIGSKSRVKQIFQELADDGISPEYLDRVHAPIGLDIGAQTPEEIATSILAEIIKVQRSPDATGKSLSDITRGS